MLLHANDRQALQRMLRTEDLLPEVAKEAELRTQLYHRDGNSGPLGTLECINILRFLGLGVADEVKNVQLDTYDFRKIPIGSDIWVKDEIDGYYRKATYVADHPMGRIAVRYVGQQEVQEAKPCNCLRYEPPADMIAGYRPVVDSPIEENTETRTVRKGKKPEPAAA